MSRVLQRAVAIVVLTAIGAPAPAEVVHTERSVYQNILITEQRGQRCMKFSLRASQRRQSCVEIERPDRMVFTYTRMMMAALLLNPAPARILIVGLGGGTLPTALATMFPDSHVTVVEIDPAVVDMAVRYFDFSPGANLEVVTQDARVYGKRAALRGEQYDTIMLDAFTADYIPEHLMTREYLTEVRALLAAEGTVAANTFAFSDLYHYESVTYESVFGKFLNFKTWGSSNRVILASTVELPTQALLEERAAALQARLRRYGVPIATYPPLLSDRIDWNPNTRLLTDQYSPANLLRGAELLPGAVPPKGEER